jgi:hypothetical protein
VGTQAKPAAGAPDHQHRRDKPALLHTTDVPQHSTAATAPKRCVFCGAPPPLTNEHVFPWWVRSGDAGKTKTLYIRESGRATGERWGHSRSGNPRDVQAKAVCATCNNGWMNNLDHTLATLGPQLLKGRTIRLTKTKQEALAAWSTKIMLMLQHTHRRQDHFVIPPEDYHRFYADKHPGELMRIWAGCMEPPGKREGPAVAFAEYRLDEGQYDEALLRTVGLDPSLACHGYSMTLRIGNCVIGLLKAGSAALPPLHVSRTPRQWVEIWPAIGTKNWPPKPQPPIVGLPPLPIGLSRTTASQTDSSTRKGWNPLEYSRVHHVSLTILA